MKRATHRVKWLPLLSRDFRFFIEYVYKMIASLSQRIKLNPNRLIHSLKTAIAFLLGLLIARWLHFPLQGQWVLISILVVMCAQSRVGALLQKSYMRLLGTLIGAIIAGLTLWLAYPNLVWITLILGLSTILFSYLAASPGYLSEAGPLGAVTVVIILVGQDPSFESVLSRFLEISLGIAIALLVSRFIWPLHSRTQLRLLIRGTLRDLQVLAKQLGQVPIQELSKQYDPYEEKIINDFASQKQLTGEVNRETFGRVKLTKRFQSILRREREVLRYLNLMKNVWIHASDRVRERLTQQTDLSPIYQRIDALFNAMIAHLSDKADLHSFSEARMPLIVENSQVCTENSEDQFYIDLFRFAANHLLTHLEKLYLLINKI